MFLVNTYEFKHCTELKICHSSAGFKIIDNLSCLCDLSSIFVNVLPNCSLLCRDVARVIIQSDQWEEALRNTTVPLVGHSRKYISTTPFRKMIIKMPGDEVEPQYSILC